LEAVKKVEKLPYSTSEDKSNQQQNQATHSFALTTVEFVFSPQHETSCDPETTIKEDDDH